MTLDINNYFSNLNKTLSNLNQDDLNFAIDLIKNKIQNNKKIITCGNGGSAHTASHYITDWNKSYNLKTGNLFKGFSLCDNLGLITAFGNDLSYNDVFSGQLKSIGEVDDLLIVVSGSGNSKNIVEVLLTAREIGITTLGFLGYDGGKCIKLTDYAVHIPSFDMQICEDIHLIIGHLIMKNICKY